MVPKKRKLGDSRAKLKSKTKTVSKRELRERTKALRGKQNLLTETDSNDVAIVDLSGPVPTGKGFVQQTDSDMSNSDTCGCTSSDITANIEQAEKITFVETSCNTPVMVIKPADDISDCQMISDSNMNLIANKKTKGKKNKKKRKAQLMQQSCGESRSVPNNEKSKRKTLPDYQDVFKKQRNRPKFESTWVMNNYKRRLQKEAVDEEGLQMRKKMLMETSDCEDGTQDVTASGEGGNEGPDGDSINSSSPGSPTSDADASDEDALLESLEKEEALFRVFGHDQVEKNSCGVFGSGVNTFKFHGNGDPVENEEGHSRGENSEKSNVFENMDVSNVKQSKKMSERGKHLDDSILSDETTDTLRCVSLSLPYEEASVVILAHPQELCIQGKACITMVMGHMTIMGYRLQPGKEHKVYSPLSNSYSVLKTIDASDDFDTLHHEVSDIMGHASSTQEYKGKLNEFRGEQFVVFIVRPLDCEAHNYISSMSPYNGLFAIRTDVPLAHNVALLPLGVGLFQREYVMRPWLKMSKDISRILELWVSMLSSGNNSARGRPPVLLICGGKNSGKSTLNRHLINAALNVLKRVDYLELDIGQTEFCPPGCLALHHVTEPVLGPPFSHIRKAEWMCYYGGVTANVNVPLYSKCVKYMFAAYKGDNPLIINTMGWNTGIGVKLLVDVLHITDPDIVVQIDSYKTTDNLPPVTPRFKMEEEGWLYNMKPEVKPTEGEGHELCVVQTPVRKLQEKFITWTAADHRNVTLLSYFCDTLDPGEILQSMVPYTVPWSAVAVHICDVIDVPASKVLLVLNASIVGLCRADLPVDDSGDDRYPQLLTEFPMCQCLGFGLVRGINVETKRLYIVTPMALDELTRVNVLVKGSLVLPDQVIKQQKNTIPKPYWDSLTRSTGSWKMSSKARKMRRPGAAFRSRQK